MFSLDKICSVWIYILELLSNLSSVNVYGFFLWTHIFNTLLHKICYVDNAQFCQIEIYDYAFDYYI